VGDIGIGTKCWAPPVRYGRRDERWRELEVVGETARSWLIGSPEAKWAEPAKIPKSNPGQKGHVFDRAEVDLIVWADKHKWRIGDAVSRAEPSTVLAVAKLIGGVPLPGDPEVTP